MSERGTNVDPEIDIDVSEPANGASRVEPAPARPAAPIRTASEALAAEPAAAMPLSEAALLELIGFYDRDAKALGNDPSAARLHFEMGLLWEQSLKNPRNAALCYQNAYRLSPRFLPNIRAARRLFAEVGNWQMVGQLLDAELAVADNDAARTALSFEKVLVLDERLGHGEEAMVLAQQLVRQSPRDLNVLGWLENAYTARNDFPRLKDLLVQLSEAVSDPGLQSRYLMGAARLCGAHLQDPAQEAELYRRAFALTRDDPRLLGAIRRTAEREGRGAELLEALTAEAALPGADAALIHYRISRVHEREGRPAEALEALRAAQRADADDPLILDELAGRFEAAGDWNALAEVLRARLAKLEDPNELIAVNLRLGELSEGQLADEAAAIGHYRAVLAIAPSHSVAVGSLGKLYSRTRDWTGLLEVMEAEIGNAEDPRQKAARLYKAAELLETRLDRAADAIDRYNEILQLQPGYLPAQKALIRLYERGGRWNDLIALYEQDLTQTRDRDQMLAILTRIADVYEERVEDLQRAAETLGRILEIAPNHLPTIRDLAHLYERAEMWEDLIRVNELEASLAGDARQVISLLHGTAEIFEDRLKDEERAVAAYQKVLSLSPNYLPALKALGRLYGREERWAELVDMNRQEAEVTPSPELAAELILKAGELLEVKLGRTDEAIAAYQEALTLSPDNFPAMRALSRIYRANQSWESLIEILRAEAAARTDKAERANTLFQVGTLWEEELGRPEFAIECYGEVLALVPGHLPARRALERLHAARGEVEPLVALLERTLELETAPAARIATLEKLAMLFADRLKDQARAARCCEQILELDPVHLGALEELAALSTGDRSRRAGLRARIAAALPDPLASAAAHLSAAHDRELAGAAEPSVAALRRAVELNPSDALAASRYERALRLSGEWSGLAAWIEQQLADGPAPEQRLVLLMRLGELCEWHLGRLERALSCYREALTLDAAFLPALRAARRLLARGGAHAEVYRLLLAEGQAVRDPGSAIEALLEAGRTAEEKLNDQDGARAAYQAALGRDPLEPRANQRLEKLLTMSGSSAEIAALHLARAKNRAAQGDGAAAAEQYLQAATVFATPLRDGARALEALDQALLLVPGHSGALRLRGDLCLAAGRHVEAAQAYLLRLEQGGDARELGELHHRLGVMFQDHLGDPGRASAHLQTALVSEPRNIDALERLGNLHLSVRNWSGAADAYRRLIEADPDPVRLSRHLCNFALIADQGFGEHAAAAANYRKALELSPGDEKITEKLIGLYERLNDLAGLSALLEEQAARAAESKEKARALSLRMKAGELYARQSDQSKAIQQYRFAVELAPDNIPARAALAELLSRDPASVPAGIEEHRNLLKLDPFRLDSYHVLYRLYANSRQLDRAVCAGHVLSFFKALTEAETASFSEARGRVPHDTTEILGAEDLDAVLQHPGARSPLADVMRIIGDQLHKIHEPRLAGLGLGRSDRMKADHAVYKAIKPMCAAFGIEKFEIYQGKGGAQITLENTDPASLVVGPDFVRRFNQREQRFLIARAVCNLRNKMALAHRLDTAQLEDLLGQSIRAAIPGFDKLGRPDPEMSKRIRKVMSGKALKQLEQVAAELEARPLDVAGWVQASSWTADRAGLLMCGDISAALQLMLREDPSIGGQTRLDGPEQIAAALAKRRDMFELVAFVLSDDHFKLRTRLRLSLT